jgi:hypothetical protein
MPQGSNGTHFCLLDGRGFTARTATLQFIHELIQAIPVDTGPCPEIVRPCFYGFWDRDGFIGQSFSQGSIENFLEWLAQFSRAPLQNSRKIIIDG